MKSKVRKTGGAYRRKVRALSLHAKPGKDRTKQNKQITPSKEIEIQVKMRGLKNESNNV